METEILTRIGKASKGLGSIEPVDKRRSLAKNSRATKKWKKRKVDELKGMVWHQELGWGSVEAVAKYHTGSKSHLQRGGVESIAYTFAIRRDGQIVLCNRLDRAPWSQGFKDRPGDENAEFLSVMFEGLFRGPGVTDPSAGEPNDDQLTAGMTLWRVCKQKWSWREDDLYGHYHFGKPSCPGDTLRAVIDSINANVEKPQYDFDTVEGRQQALKDLGFYRGAVDGSWGPMSKGALVHCQQDLGLTADGVWGPKTERAIGTALRV